MKHYNPARKLFRFALVAAAGAAMASAAAAQPLATVRFASVGGLTDAPVYIADQLGYFAKAGLKVDRQRMPSAPSLMTATATNQVDVAGISITPGLYASVQRGVNLRIVGDKQSLRPGVSATRLVIRSDLSKGNEAADLAALKGKTVAVSSKASSVYMLLEKLLKKHGMTLADIHVVELSYPNILPALTSKAIDAAIDLEPFMSEAIQSGAAKVVSDLTEVVPPEGATIVPLVYSEAFAKKRKTAQAFMTAFLRGARIYNDAMVRGKDKEKVIAIIAKYANVKPEIVRRAFPASFDPNQKVSVPFLEDLQAFFVAQHFLRKPIDVNKIVDPSFAKAAVKALGTYEAQ